MRVTQRAIGIVEVETQDKIPETRLKQPVFDPPETVSRCLQALGFTLGNLSVSFVKRTSETFRLREPEGAFSYSFGPSPPTGSYCGRCSSLRLDTIGLSATKRGPPLGKNAILPRTIAGFTPPRFDHESFAVRCPLALLSIDSYPILVHRPAVSLHASSPYSVTLMQLRFAPFTVVSLWEDFHLQDRADAGQHTTKTPGRDTRAFSTSLPSLGL
jgi:hypothetical protein